MSSKTSVQTEPETFLTLLTQEVIPRLVLLEQPPAQAAPMSPGSLGVAAMPTPVDGPLRDQADALASLAAAGDLVGCEALVRGEMVQGLRTDAVFLSLIQPAARLLGERWVKDTSAFTDVTIGLWTLQHVFSQLLDQFHAEATPGEAGPRLFLCTVPGAHHRLGLRMVGAFFARAGWSVISHESGEEPDLLEAAAASGADMIGLSLATEHDMRLAPALIARLRQVCRKQQPAIMIGGPAIEVFPAKAAACGADLVSGDAPEAVAAAQQFLSRRGHHGSH
ncbi:MAG: cobalamin B12-binding domain-containing protein [Burkholderiaceae bacterium]|jgi:methanogenic corrinoid protein MtbC1